MLLYDIQERGFLASFLPFWYLALFHTNFTPCSQRNWNLFFTASLAVWVCLGRRHKEPIKALHLQQERRKQPRKGFAAKRSVSACSLFGPNRAWVLWLATKRLVTELLKFLLYLSCSHTPNPTVPFPRAWVNAQIWFFRRLWESGRKRQKSRTHEAVAPLKRERTEDPQGTVKTRWSRGRRRPRRDAGGAGTGGGQ